MCRMDYVCKAHINSNVYHTIEGIRVSQWLGQKQVGIYMVDNPEKAELLEHCIAVLEREGVFCGITQPMVT